MLGDELGDQTVAFPVPYLAGSIRVFAQPGRELLADQLSQCLYGIMVDAADMLNWQL
jgi:hypothetical protein